MDDKYSVVRDRVKMLLPVADEFATFLSGRYVEFESFPSSTICNGSSTNYVLTILHDPAW
jgi:hypothetical protein